MSSRTMTGEDQDCISFLLSLKHHNVSPTTMTRDDMTSDFSTISSNSVSTTKSTITSAVPTSAPAPAPSRQSFINQSVRIPEPLFRKEESISPTTVNMCRSGTRFPLPLHGMRPGMHPSGSQTFNLYNSTLHSRHSHHNHGNWNSHNHNHNQHTVTSSHQHQHQHHHTNPYTNLNASGPARYERTPTLLPSVSKSPPQSRCQSDNEVEMDLSDDQTILRLMGDSELVDMQDREFIPDYIFLAMAQLQPCFVTPVDKIGTYKTREVGFKGMSCKHCGGEPGFGRYFPETLRSLSQTTTSQTIVKHIAFKCRACPREIRNSVRALKEQQDTKDQMAKEYRRSRFEERPKYGSRKVFFQRLWSRLHDASAPSPKNSNRNKDLKQLVRSPKAIKKNFKGKKGSTAKGTKSGRYDHDHPIARNSNIFEMQVGKSPRKRVVSYGEDEGENVPPSTVLKIE